MKANNVEKVVRTMKDVGASNMEIGLTIGRSEAAIKSFCHERAIKRTLPESRRYALPISNATLQLFRDEADRRGKRFENFMRDMLHTIARDNLYSAIIDDGK